MGWLVSFGGLKPRWTLGPFEPTVDTTDPAEAVAAAFKVAESTWPECALRYDMRRSDR